MTVREDAAIAEQVLGLVRSAGAAAAAVVLVRGRSLEARVRGLTRPRISAASGRRDREATPSECLGLPFRQEVVYLARHGEIIFPQRRKLGSIIMNSKVIWELSVQSYEASAVDITCGLRDVDFVRRKRDAG